MEDVQENTFNHILNERIGFKKIQFLACLACSFIWMGDGAEMYIQSFLSPLLQKEFNISEKQALILPSVVFWGNFVGSLTSGLVSDPYSRKYPLIFSILGLSISAISSTFAQSYILLLILRGIFGFFFGIVTTLSITYVSEILPKNVRGRYYLYFAQSWPVGELICILIAYNSLDNLENGNMRALLFFSAIPSFISLLICSVYLFESPRHALTIGYKDQYQKLFKLIDDLGTKSDPKFIKLNEIEKNEIAQQGNSISRNAKPANFKVLFIKKNLIQTIKVTLIWQSLAFVYYGVNFSLPTMILKMNKESNSDKKQDFIGLILSVLSEFPSYWVSGYLVENKQYGGRKNIMLVSYIIGTICSLICLFLNDPNWIFIGCVSILKFFMSMAFMVVNTFTTELYSTDIRATSLGFFNATCKLTGVFMPIIVNLFYTFGPTGPFLIFGALSAVSGFSMMSMKDTTDTDLDNQESQDVQENFLLNDK